MSAVFETPVGTSWNDDLAFQSIIGEITPGNELLRLIAERIRVAADQLKLSRADLFRIFSRHSVFEAETAPGSKAGSRGYLLVETHHLIHGKVGKGALKIVFPEDLLGKGAQFRPAAPGVVEVTPPGDHARWATEREAEAVVKRAMREQMTGESLSMSLKSQATGAPFAGSEGLVLCACRQFDQASGRYLLKPALDGGDPHAQADKELIESMMNATAEVLTRGHRIAHDRIVHAAETNTTLTSRLQLQLAANVVEGHLRTLLETDPAIIIGDEDMTPRLREILGRADYAPTQCALAKAAATMQREHAILLPSSRARLRNVLAQLPSRGAPASAQYREVIDIFFGRGDTQNIEDSLFHHREPILRALSVALSARCLDECGDPHVLALYLKTFLDNQRIILESVLLKCLRAGQSLPVDWFERAALLSREQERQLAELLPTAATLKETAREHFVAIVNILFQALAGAPPDLPEPYWRARKEVLELAIRAITATGDVVPPVERIMLFTLPFTYECATPKLGVVTRKPVEVCGSELRREAMAVGAVMAIEIALKQLTARPHPLEGLAVAIEGLGNAGKHVARIMAARGARMVGVSDSRGAVLKPGGFSSDELTAILAHKDSGRRLDTLLGPEAAALRAGNGLAFDPAPEVLRKVKTDILVLTAVPGAIHEGNLQDLQAGVVCELTGAAVTSGAKALLRERHIHIIPDNLASSGGLLVSLSEMLQNSAGQVWDRRLEERNLYEQLSQSYAAALELTREYQVDIPTASDILALQRLQELAAYREELERLAQALAERLRSIGPNQRVLIVSDDDEDGVASAAIMCRLISLLTSVAKDQIVFLNESFRSDNILEFVQQTAGAAPVAHLFALDRSFPLEPAGQAMLARLAERCGVTFINNHNLPPDLLRKDGPAPATDRPNGRRSPADLGVLLISPQTLQATVPAREFPTAMILKELAHQLVPREQDLRPIDWQAAVGSCLEAPTDTTSAWQWFYTQFNPDKTGEVSRAIRLVTRAGGFRNAIQALAGVERPDQLETNAAWGQFMAEYKVLEERVQVLVEKIVLENRRRPFTAHFFTHAEVASPSSIIGNELKELDFYPWISEHLTQRADLAEKPIIVGQVIQDPKGRRHLGVRIRSPREVNLMETGLPRVFTTGGLANTAVARIPIASRVPPSQMFDELVEEIWMKTTSPLPLGPKHHPNLP